MNAAYRPGACNIGAEEIERRRRSAAGMTIVAALVAVALVVSGVPHPYRAAVLPFAAAAGVTWLQVVRRFCVAFGALGVLNFGVLGSTETVADPAARSADRRTALRMILEGFAYGLIATGLVVLLPI